MLSTQKTRLTAILAGCLFLAVLIFASIVAVEHYEPTQWQAEQDAKNQGEAKAIDILGSERVAYYTKILAIFTGVLSGFGLLQIYFLIRADSATATALAASTKQAEIANKQYIASNRPRLRVRKIEIDRPVSGNMIRVRYEVVNVGGTNAHIIDNQITIRIDDMPYGWLMYHGGKREVIGARQFHFADEVRRGEALIATEEIIMFDPNWGFDAGAWWRNRLYVIGIIRYTDDNGVTRRTGFYRVATEDPNRFVIAPLERTTLQDHEYED